MKYLKLDLTPPDPNNKKTRNRKKRNPQDMTEQMEIQPNGATIIIEDKKQQRQNRRLNRKKNPEQYIKC
ncbi:hypothetical protein C922_05543 [Plasmodium inui San Antonio 1]|uniref:Uncharacterized protein n=1 Tax=Plasmodium inui San Antonio 1 TaxID=1237626 RepID=W6ZXU7_9APIC|nr:hypothetical protein C922_05543 [Plasmodium inui San Antonio 1]EUD64080.1 hypothetical protein C922_05543 [Plasmodium inui San Antonio 1]